MHEAKMSGAIIHTPCVNRSNYETTLYGNDVFLGFMFLKGLEASVAQQIVQQRESNGNYTSLEDFINRIPIGIEGVQTLIFAGAFAFTGKAKRIACKCQIVAN